MSVSEVALELPGAIQFHDLGSEIDISPCIHNSIGEGPVGMQLHIAWLLVLHMAVAQILVLMAGVAYGFDVCMFAMTLCLHADDCV